MSTILIALLSALGAIVGFHGRDWWMRAITRLDGVIR